MKGRFGCLQWKNMMGVWEQYWAIQYWAVDKNCRILGPAGPRKNNRQVVPMSCFNEGE